jgi:hypothetical protein
MMNSHIAIFLAGTENVGSAIVAGAPVRDTCPCIERSAMTQRGLRLLTGFEPPFRALSTALFRAFIRKQQ